MALKVIGAGFGRTGTLSLKMALEELGFGKCYHMEEIMKYPRHLKVWGEIFHGADMDWEDLFKGYQSSTDWPVAAYYRELMEVYPDAKIILTVRDPEGWHKSIMNTVYQLSRKFARFTRVLPVVHRFFIGMEKVIWEGIFHQQLEDKDYAIEIFKRHIEEVKRIVPKERLLVFEARQGWEPLCKFLDVPIPENKPYPHKNNGTVVRRILKHRTALKWSALVFLITLLILLVRVLVV